MSEKAGLANDAWALAVRLPSGVCAHSFAAGVRAEGLPCEPGQVDGVVYLPLCASYSAEDAEHLVLGVAKVAHYLMTDANGASAAASETHRGDSA